jgi:hypothetical protein
MTTRPSARAPATGFFHETANGYSTMHRDPHGLNGTAKKLGVHELERRFTELTQLLYTTSVPVPELREKVYPHLAPSIVFRDPWARASGLQQFWVGLRGFHAVIRFDFEIFQLAVELNERGDGGRVLVDGVMNLKQLVVYTYPLRTQLVYEFEITPDGESFQITSLEEMWSLGDFIANAPGVGFAYEGFRWACGYLFTGMFWLAAAVVEKMPYGRMPLVRNRSASP